MTLLQTYPTANVFSCDGVQTVWNFSFTGGYIDRAHVKAAYTEASGAVVPVPVNSAMFIGPYQLSITPPLVAGGTLTLYRSTPKELPLVDFADGARISETSLDIVAKQAVFVASETLDGFPDIRLVNNRANKLWGFDGNGNFAVVVPAAQSASALALSLAGSSGASQVGFTAAGIGAVARTVQDKLRDVLSVADFGILPGADYASTNCTKYPLLAAVVTALGGNVDIVWPAGVYHFSPKDNSTFSGGAAYAWRNAIELVDVSGVYHHMPGVTIYHRADSGWFRGNSTPVLGLDESVLQFRATAAGLCNHIGVIGPCVIKTDATTVDTTTGHPDGATFGIAYRGCVDTFTANADLQWWGTDGLYFGTGYGNTPRGERHTIINPRTYRCFRQGISVVGNDHGTIHGGSLEETQGGSFGHGIDFEPNSTMTQRNWRLFGTRTYNNQRGACNFINTSDVTWFGPDISESASTTAGSVYVEGSNVVGYDAANIKFIGGRVTGTQAFLYSPGATVAGGGVDLVEFIDCELGSYADSASLNSGACLRVNATGLTGRTIKRINIRGGRIYGNGGMTVRGDGTTQATLRIDDVEWCTTNPNGATVTFNWGTNATCDVHLSRVRHTVDSSKTMATITPTISRGSIYDCTFSSHSGAAIQWRDWISGWTTEIGFNRWSEFSYYDGCVSALDLKTSGAVVETRGGDFGLAYRTLHGGRQRVIAFLATPAAFTGAQAVRDGDMTMNAANSGASTFGVRYLYDANLGAWRQVGHQVKRGTTPSRPAMIAADVGVQYLDTTLDADGKPIWYTGTAWVDATGATV